MWYQQSKFWALKSGNLCFGTKNLKYPNHFDMFQTLFKNTRNSTRHKITQDENLPHKLLSKYTRSSNTEMGSKK